MAFSLRQFRKGLAPASGESTMGAKLDCRPANGKKHGEAYGEQGCEEHR
jgi:hypothetical protein